MKKIVINGHVVEYNTVAELADIMSVMGMGTQAPTKAKKPTGAKAPKTTKKAQPKAEKLTRAEALAKWEAEKGITADSKAKYKALTNSNSEFYKGLWAKREGDKTYEANLKKYGKSFANKEYHKHICALASEEAKK